jgi:hypothetical protein
VGLGVTAAGLAAALIYESVKPCGDCMVNAPLGVAILSVPLVGVSTVVGGAIGVAHRDR